MRKHGKHASKPDYILYVSHSEIKYLDGFLKTLFIVSNVTILDEGSLGTDSDTRVYASSIELSGKVLPDWVHITTY